MTQSPVFLPSLDVKLELFGSKPQTLNHMGGIPGMPSPDPESSWLLKLSGGQP